MTKSMSNPDVTGKAEALLRTVAGILDYERQGGYGREVMDVITLLRSMQQELDHLAGEVERARIEGMEEALRNVWQCYTGNHPAYGVGPDWDKALDGCCELIEADIAKLKAALEGSPPEAGTTGGRTGAG